MILVNTEIVTIWNFHFPINHITWWFAKCTSSTCTRLKVKQRFFAIPPPRTSLSCTDPMVCFRRRCYVFHPKPNRKAHVRTQCLAQSQSAIMISRCLPTALVCCLFDLVVKVVRFSLPCYAKLSIVYRVIGTYQRSHEWDPSRAREPQGFDGPWWIICNTFSLFEA